MMRPRMVEYLIRPWLAKHFVRLRLVKQLRPKEVELLRVWQGFTKNVPC